VANTTPNPDPLDVVKPIHNAMSEEELTAVLKRYPDAGLFRRRISNSGRPYSAGTLMETTEGRFFLKKQSRGFRRREDILWRHTVIDHLVRRGFPTPPLLANDEGSSLTELGQAHYELFAAAPGEDRYRELHSWMPFDRVAHARAAGEMLAQFHAVTQDFPLAGATPLGHSPGTSMSARFDLAFAPDIIVALGERIAASPTLSQFFSQRRWKEELSLVYPQLHRDVYPYLAGIEPAVTHGDWHANNMFYHGDGVASVIDFHLADVSFRAYDIAVALDRNAIQWLDILAGDTDAVRFDVLECLLRGYTAVSPLSLHEAELLTALLPIHQLDLALSNVEYYLAQEGKPERAEWAYSVYLRDHARYFLTSPGKRVLAFVRSTAGDRSPAP